MIVAPERLTPGIIARHWTRPTMIDWRSVSLATPPLSFGLASFSTSRIAKPPITSAQATTTAFSSNVSI